MIVEKQKPMNKSSKDIPHYMLTTKSTLNSEINRKLVKNFIKSQTNQIIIIFQKYIIVHGIQMAYIKLKNVIMKQRLVQNIYMKKIMQKNQKQQKIKRNLIIKKMII